MLRGLFECLEGIFVDGRYADKMLEKKFKENKKWGSRDRRFLAETVYDMVRWWGTLSAYDELLGAKVDSSFVRRWVIYEAWKNNNDVSEFAEKNFPDNERKLPKFNEIKNVIESSKLEPWQRLSYPKWLYDQFVSECGLKTAEEMLNALNSPAPVTLRANTLKIQRDELQKKLNEEDIQTSISDESPTALNLVERKNVFITKAFKEGLFEVQDGASQLVAPLLDPKPGERVADTCAGAGGKTLHLAALMKNKGTLLGADVSEKKLEQLKLRARRAGVSNLRIVHFATNKDIKKHHDMFNAVLVDAPCSGSGVIRRNADTKWKLTPDELSRLHELQAHILDTYAPLVKSGGRMVYATCSLLPSENEEQVEKFVNRNPSFKTDGKPLKITPSGTGMDGFFAQRLIKA